MRIEFVLAVVLTGCSVQLSAAPAVSGARQERGFRYVDVQPGQGAQPGFTALSPVATGVFFTNVLAQARSLTNHVLLNGSGVAAGDVDGDGWCDLYFCGLDGPNALYRNLGGWRFEDITRAAGVGCPDLDATGAALADIDGDGDLDLLVNTIGRGTLLFMNDGKGHFTDVTAATGLGSKAGSMSMALADIDGDGDLDLYVANYRTWTMRDSFNMRIRVNRIGGRSVVTMVNGRPVTEPDLAGRFSIDADGNLEENGEADVLYENMGGGRFAPRSFLDGTFTDEEGKALQAAPQDWSLSAMFRDMNGDGAPDLYVCGDLGSPDRIWINTGSGKFRAMRTLGVRKTSWFSMGVDFADLNRDGLDDFFVTDMISRHHVQRQVQVSNHRPVYSTMGEIANRPQIPRNTLFLNMGAGDYTELAYYSGLDATEWSWAPVFLDVDLDGFEDALVVTGFERDVQDVDVANQLETVRRQRNLSDAEALRMRRMFPRLDLPKLAFRNRQDLTFEDVSAAWHFDSKAISQGVALADLDNDGDLDVIVNDLNSAAELFRNDTAAPRVSVRLRGRAPNTRGIGAKIRVHGGAVPMQSQEIICGGRYLSSDDPMRTFAAGSVTNRMRVEVRWRSGGVSVIDGARANRIYEIDEEDAPGAPSSSEPEVAPPLFTDVSALLKHQHQEQPYDDFARQHLLPKRLSQLGPGVAWADLDGDGWDDLLIGAGKGGRLAVYHNTGIGRFEPVLTPPFSQAVTRDQTAIVVLTREPGHTVVLAGSANYEDGLRAGSAVRQFDPASSRMDDSIPGADSSTGPVAAADVDGDGDLDLFVGGRVLPGRYPAPASSALLRNNRGRFEVDPDAARLFADLGLVSGAVFTDLDEDGYPELALACEWGPVRVFHNNKAGQFQEITRELGLEKLVGWWNGIAAGDFDGDGRMDLAASNWGQNTKYERYRPGGLRIYYGELEQPGKTEVLEAYVDPELSKVVPWQHLGRVGEALPFVRERFSTFRQFSLANVEEILGDRWKLAKELRANWLQSTVFINRGRRFEARALPPVAQLSPAFAICAGDADGDGNEDLFVSQNFFATDAETGRYDSGYGLWLQGNGNGDFKPWLPSQSGVRVYGEQRGAALCDYDGDGRLDLVVTQNAADTQLYRNTGGKAGRRLRLHGPSGNPTAIGAVVRLSVAGTVGPAKEIHAGAGYWSQDSSVLLLPDVTGPSQVIIVRWPGGLATRTGLPEKARSVEIDMSGGVRVLQ